MAHFIIFISQTLQVWANFSRKHRDARVCYYKSKTNRDINDKFTSLMDFGQLNQNMSTQIFHLC